MKQAPVLVLTLLLASAVLPLANSTCCSCHQKHDGKEIVPSNGRNNNSHGKHDGKEIIPSNRRNNNIGDNLQKMFRIRTVCEMFTVNLLEVSTVNQFVAWETKLARHLTILGDQHKLYDTLVEYFIRDFDRCRHNTAVTVADLRIVTLFYQLYPDLLNGCQLSNNVKEVYNTMSQLVTSISREFVTNRTSYDDSYYPESNGLIRTLGLRASSCLLNFRDHFDLVCPRVRSSNLKGWCILQPIVRLADSLQELLRPSVVDFQSKLNAFRLKLLYTNTDPAIATYDNPLHSNKEVIIKSNLRTIVDLVRRKEKEKLIELSKFFPNPNTITGCSTNSIGDYSDHKCTIHTLLLVLEPIASPHRRPRMGQVKTLPTSVSHPDYLELISIERILSNVESTQIDIREVGKLLYDHTTNKFTEKFNELSVFYETVADFNKRKSDADIGYLKGRLDRFVAVSRILANNVDRSVDQIIVGAMWCAGSDLVYQTTMVSLTIAQMCNPLKVITGGSSITELIDRMADLARAINTVIVAKNLMSSLEDLIRKGTIIAQGFSRNGEALRTVKALIDGYNTNDVEAFETLKDRFLEEYNNYDPQVTKPQLAELERQFEEMVEIACDIIQGTEGFLQAVYQGLVADKGTCWRLKVNIQKLMVMYSEIYDFQFELMDAMAQNMADRTMYIAAQGLKDEMKITKDDPTGFDILDRMEYLAGISYTIYRLQVLKAVEEYCDILEYKNAGTKPSVCNGMNTRISDLVGYRGPTCTKSEKYVNIPVRSSTSNPNYSSIRPGANNDLSVLDINSLLAGEPVEFQVPNSDWLVNNGWITSNYQNSAIYVKKFIVYLPVESSSFTTVSVNVTAISDNKLRPTSYTEYDITPKIHLVSEYIEGRTQQSCSKTRIDNPFDREGCSESHELPRICPTLLGPSESDTILYPSVYSKFLIKVTSDTYMSKEILFSTPVNVKADVELCIIHQQKGRALSQYMAMFSKYIERAHSSQYRSEPHCCSSSLNQFWLSVWSECVNCPAGSTSVLGGNHCEDTNECNSSPGPCDRYPQATCVNTMGSYVCVCPAGFTGNGIAEDGCRDINECHDSQSCPMTESDCTNTPGGFECSCPTGYTWSETYLICQDINECLLPRQACNSILEYSTITSDLYTCHNTIGSFECSCINGYKSVSIHGGKQACIDIDECREGNPCWVNNQATSMYSNQNALCTNTLGSFTCKCPRQYPVGGGIGPNGCTQATCIFGDVRLRNNLNRNLEKLLQGRVEVCFNNEWVSINNRIFDDNAAKVVCRQLGLNFEGAAVATVDKVDTFGLGNSSIVLSNLHCNGDENYLLDCATTFPPPVDKNVTGPLIHWNDAGVICPSDGTCSTENSIRLVGALSNKKGQVEVCKNNKWRPVCQTGTGSQSDIHWNTNIAKVVCHSLGFSRNDVEAYSGRDNVFGGLIQNQEKYIKFKASCSGTEDDVSHCDPDLVDSSNCRNSASINCQVNTNDHCHEQDEIRLVGGYASWAGRVQSCGKIGSRTFFGNICPDSNWNTEAATVACKQLGYSKGEVPGVKATIPGQLYFTQYEHKYVMNTEEFSCIPVLHDSLRDCYPRRTEFETAKRFCESPYNSKYAQVICKGCKSYEVKIDKMQNSTNDYRLRMCYDNEWFEPCFDEWDDRDATVACRYFGFSEFGASAYYVLRDPQLDRSIPKRDRNQNWSAKLKCEGDEQSLADCDREAFYTNCRSRHPYGWDAAQALHCEPFISVE